MDKRNKQYQDSAKIMMWTVLAFVAFCLGYLFFKISYLFNHL